MIKYNNSCTRRHSRPNSNINHTLKHSFSRHTDKTVFKTEHLLSIAAENSFLIATVGLLPINKSGNPVRIMNIVGVVKLALLRERVGIKVCNDHSVGIKSSNRSIFLFL